MHKSGACSYIGQVQVDKSSTCRWLGQVQIDESGIGR